MNEHTETANVKQKRPRIENHNSGVARVYADQITLKWWKQLDARQRGEILQQYRERNVTTY